MSLLLASLCVAAIVLALVVVTRPGKSLTDQQGQAGGTIFGRPLHRPRLWATGVVCLGVSGLLRLALIEDMVPGTWQTPVNVAFTGLTGAFLVILVTHLVLQIREHG